ncbi:TVP38/TMEM64 family protein [Rhodococcus aetherivorans]|uniref:TVP38/TMEM64 family protein n=1 Tax=Rhodococcus TaxID=1827 RepID=UPI000B007844|nr:MULTISPECIES: TVP38/TMEM64 family protein [Rhodococcus]QPG47980.1 TVP38/TMEM64 family protein [Rhodococcus sp. M8]USC18205.1 TVP38/TMEM64 family protein [Rhodococcus sp. 11-3]WKX01502.1 TVP38/TMEM64 family protein [Rhodococcus aetherivorans]
MLRDRRILGALAVLAALAVVAVLLPHPSVAEVRAWAESAGPLFPLLFFLIHAVVTVAPFPRTVFTLSAGVLFGSATGIAVTVAATTVSAVLALLLVRAIGRGVVEAHLNHPTAQAVDERLARRGWLAVGSLRLIAPLPFAVVNYCCGVSSVRLVPYTLGTVAGILPGTVGVVLLGDALTGRTDPALLAVSAVCIALGASGLWLESRLPAPRPAPDRSSLKP